jgi:hypothetical protein
MVRSFPNIVKQVLSHLPTNNYPVLHSCLFFPIWLTFILDKSLKGTFERKKPQNKENTITKEQFMEWTKSVWTMNTESAKKVGHPALFLWNCPTD